MQKKMETTGIIGFYRDNRKENGNYYGILGLYQIGIMEKKVDTNYYSVLGLYSMSAFKLPASVEPL